MRTREAHIACNALLSHMPSHIMLSHLLFAPNLTYRLVIKQRNKKISLLFRRFFTLWSYITVYTYRGGDGKHGEGLGI